MAQPRSRAQAGSVLGAGRAIPLQAGSAYGDGGASQQRRKSGSKPAPCAATGANRRGACERAPLDASRNPDLSADRGPDDDGSLWQLPAASDLDSMRRTTDILAAAHVDNCIPDVANIGTDMDALSQLYERKLLEQNQRFWETSKRMDNALTDEENCCVALRQALSEVESNHEELAASSETRFNTAESNFGSIQLETEKLRKAGRERVASHAANMEALSEKLCHAQQRCLEFEGAVKKSQSDASAAKHELWEEAQEHAAITIKLQGVLELESKLNQELEANCHLLKQEKLLIACEAKEVQQRHLLELSAEELQSAKRDHEADMDIARRAIQETHKEHVLEEAAAIRKEAENLSLHEEIAALQGGLDDLRRDAAEASIARAEEQKEMNEVRRLQTVLALSEHKIKAESDRAAEARINSSNEIEKVQIKMAALRQELALGVDRFSRDAEELRQSELECKAEARIAANATCEAEAARKRLLEANEQQASSAKLVALLRQELQTSELEREQQRHFYVTSHRTSAKTEEQAVRTEANWAKQQIAMERDAASEAIAEAAEATGEARAQRDAEGIRASELSEALLEKNSAFEACKQDLELAETRLAALESACASEWGAAQLTRSNFEESVAGMIEQFALDLDEVNNAADLVQQQEAKEASAAHTEAEACVNLQQQASAAREKVAKLQIAAEGAWLENEELASELAQAREDSKRHARNATDFRAELVSTKRDLAKQRHAERDLQQATDELDAISAKLGHIQRARDAAEHAVKQGQSREAALERQARDLQTRLTAERLVRQDRAPNIQREASAETLLYSDQQGLFPVAARPSSGRSATGLSQSRSKEGLSPLGARPSSGSAALGWPAAGDSMAASGARPSSGKSALNQPAGSSLALDVATGARALSPSLASPGMGRSQSHGALTATVHIDSVDLQGGAGQMQNASVTCDAGGSMRASPHGASFHPPRPPQTTAPRMGWATHARSRGDRTPERHGDVQYSPDPEASSSSIDRAIRQYGSL